MLKYFIALKPDWDEFVQEIKALMDNPAEFFASKPEEAKTFCVVSLTDDHYILMKY